MKLLDHIIIDYKSIVSSPRSIWESKQDLDAIYNVYIPVRGRLNFFEPCIRYLRNASEKADIKISIFVIENDFRPLYQDISSRLRVSYVFIPSDISGSKGLFAKSLCYNIGYLMSVPTPWCIFHDLDMIVEEDFFQKIKIHLSRDPNWLQPYSARRVMRLGSYITGLITSNPTRIYPLTAFADIKPANPGSPGGSIVVRNTDFMKIGGYDPEFFYGYAPEDSFFWAKLEHLYGNIPGPLQKVMLGKASYADEPSIDVYHLDHPLQQSANPDYFNLVSLQTYFCSLDGPEREKIVTEKSKRLKAALSEIRP
jgi:hypothetical protein